MQPYKTMLSKKTIEEFKQIYEEEYKEKIDDKTALKKAVALLTIFKSIYKPVTNEMKYETERIQGQSQK